MTKRDKIVIGLVILGIAILHFGKPVWFMLYIISWAFVHMLIVILRMMKGLDRQHYRTATSYYVSSITQIITGILVILVGAFFIKYVFPTYSLQWKPGFEIQPIIHSFLLLFSLLTFFICFLVMVWTYIRWKLWKWLYDKEFRLEHQEKMLRINVAALIAVISIIITMILSTMK